MLLVGLMAGLMVVDIMVHQFRFIIINLRTILPVLVILVISILPWNPEIREAMRKKGFSCTANELSCATTIASAWP